MRRNQQRSRACGDVRGGSPQAAVGTRSGLSVHGGDVPMAELNRGLSSVLGRPVLDRTGIARTFDVRLEFAVDDTVAGFMNDWGTVQGHRESMTAMAVSGDRKSTR